MTPFKADQYWSQEMQAHKECADKTSDLLFGAFESMLEACAACIKNGGKILFFGNGGSAADAQHLATELTIRYVKDRPPIAAIALTTDTSSLTAAGNDFGFDHIFSRQIEALGNKGDVAIAISTSGKSPNIINALRTARQKGLVTSGLSGRDGGAMPNLCDIMVIVPSQETARIQEMHILLGHLLCGALEQKLGLI